MWTMLTEGYIQSDIFYNINCLSSKRVKRIIVKCIIVIIFELSYMMSNHPVRATRPYMIKCLNQRDNNYV